MKFTAGYFSYLKEIEMTDKIISTNERLDADDANRDLNSGMPGAHPIGVAVSSPVGGVVAGIVAGAAMGAAAATIAGPVGTVVGAAVGVAVGGFAGKSATDGTESTIEDAYWRENYAMRPYISGSGSFDDYGPAYSVGTSGYRIYPGKSFDEIEPHHAIGAIRAANRTSIGRTPEKLPATRGIG